MILAAGRGERLRPLTDTIPKPLLEIAGKPLIVYQLEALAKANVHEIVINLGHLGQQIRAYLGDGGRYAVDITYSDEGDVPLETAGGIIQALPLLGDESFIVTNADIYTDFDYAALPVLSDKEAHLILVENPPHNLAGDFALRDGKVAAAAEQKLTYSGIGVYRPVFFKGLAHGKRPLAPLLYAAAEQGRVSGECYSGFWSDIGTKDRLDSINKSKYTAK